MIRKAIIPFIFLVLVNSLLAQKINRFNKNGERSGLWITYQDSAKKIKSFKGRYKNGITVGRVYYYSPDGKLERKEINRFGVLHTKNYYSNGKIRSCGKARLENLPDRIHYYYFGKWKYFDEEGHLIKYCYYESGNMINSVYTDKNNKLNDSLMFALNYLEKEFFKNNAALLKTLNDNYYDNAKCEKLKITLFNQDSATFIAISKILNVYGNPNKLICGDSYTIPFFIISFAPASIRKKFESLFISSAQKGDLEWSSVAHFIDKLKIAEGKAQTFGTQYYYNPKWQKIYYAIEDSANINLRRKQIGLEDFETHN